MGEQQRLDHSAGPLQGKREYLAQAYGAVASYA